MDALRVEGVICYRGLYRQERTEHLTQDTNEASRPTEDTEPSASATSNEEPTTPGQTEGVEATDDTATATSEASEQPDEIATANEERAEPTADGATPTEGVTDAQGTATAGAEVTAGPATASEPATAAEPAPADASAEGALDPEPVAEAAASPVEESEAVPPTTEAMTMAELLDHPDHAVKSLKHGDVVEGTVVRIDPDEILVDFGGKSEGVVSNRELMNRRGPRDGDERSAELSVGDEVLVYVLQPESPEGHAVLSLRRAGLERKWRAMQERFDAGEIVEARVIDHNKGG